MKRRRSGTRSPKRKGGVRQRMQARRDENWIPGTSALTALLVSLFAWGEMSPQLAQKIALAAFEDAVKFKDGVTSLEELRKVGDIGSRGYYPNKCFSEFISAIPMKINIPEAMSCRLPFKNPLGMLNQCMLWPHELFSAIWHFYPGTWRRSILPSQERLCEFWRTNRLHPSFFASEVKLIPDFDQWVVPLSIHGDEVPITGIGKSWAQQMVVMSWSSMVGFGTTNEAQFLIFGLFEKLRSISQDVGKDTLNRFFTMLAWSLRWLLRGQWPDRDVDGLKFLCCSSWLAFLLLIPKTRTVVLG